MRISDEGADSRESTVKIDDSRESAIKIHDSHESAKITIGKLMILVNHQFQESSYWKLGRGYLFHRISALIL